MTAALTALAADTLAALFIGALFWAAFTTPDWVPVVAAWVATWLPWLLLLAPLAASWVLVACLMAAKRTDDATEREVEGQ